MFEFFDQVILFFDQISEFITSGIYDFFTEVFAELVIYLTISAIKFKIFMITFAWNSATQIIISLDLSSHIQSAFSSLDSQLLSFISFLRIPEAINIVMSAYVTRYIMSMIGL